MSSAFHNITFDCADPRAQAAFWSQVTGLPVTREPDAESSDAAVGHVGDRPRLYFVHVPEPKTVKNRVHLDVMPADRTQDEELTRLTGLGATVISDPRPEFGWVVLADPEGNEFCLEPGPA